jgi:methyltransferase (TIGR00027 family)
METYIKGIPLSNVSCTMFLMLYGRVTEGLSKDPILRDPKAEEIVAQINDSLLHSDDKLLRRLAQGKMSWDLAAHAAIRARQYDSYALEFMRNFPQCTIVNLGCGMDTRFWRIDDGRMRFFDLDLPEVILLKRQLVQETERYRMVGCSVLDHAWMDAVISGGNPAMFLAEGLFMYLPKDEVRALIEALGRRVREGQLVAELAHEKYPRGFNKRLLAFKLKHELGLQDPPAYLCGFSDSDEIASWSPRLHLIDDWSYFDSPVKKLGWRRMFRHFKSLRKSQWTVRYRIGE